MRSSCCLLALLLLLQSLLLPTALAVYTYSPLSTGSCIPNYGLRWVNASRNNATLPNRLVYPACAYNNHLLPNSPAAAQGALMFAYGGYPAYKGPVQGTLYTSTTGFQSLLYPAYNASASLQTNWGGLAAVTANGTMILYGGRVGTSASTTSPATKVSFDQGRTWTVSALNNSAPAKYETPMLAIPQTSWLVIIGGYNAAGAQTNQVWLSQDGLGANWTLQSAASPVATTSLGAAVALSDSSYVSSALYSTPNSTLIFFLEFDDGCAASPRDTASALCSSAQQAAHPPSPSPSVSVPSLGTTTFRTTWAGRGRLPTSTRSLRR